MLKPEELELLRNSAKGEQNAVQIRGAKEEIWATRIRGEDVKRDLREVGFRDGEKEAPSARRQNEIECS